MQDRLHIMAIRECRILGLHTDAENREVRREWIDLAPGQSRGDVQFVLGLDGSMSDLPDDYEHISDEQMATVHHPTKVGETVETYGVIRLTRLP